MRVCTYHSEIKSDNKGILWQYVTAKSNVTGRELLVLKRNENGECWSRNIEIHYCSPYLVEFPGENYFSSAYYGEYKGQIRNWMKIDYDVGFDNVSEDDIKPIFEKYPDFIYTVRKMSYIDATTVFRLLQVWKKDKGVEILVAADQWQLVFNKNFIRLPKEKKMEVVRFIRDKLDERLRLVEVQMIMKRGCTKEDVRGYLSFRRYDSCTFDEYLFCRNMDKRNRGLYLDIVRMIKMNFKTRLKDRYWHYPKDVEKIHDKLMAEIKEINELRKAKELELKQKNLKKAVRKYASKQVSEGKWTAYVADDVNDINMQAEKLNQCLITADYIGKVIKGECILVFVRFNGKPVATAEIKPGKKLGQFYSNEKSKNIYPSQKAEQILKKWMEVA
ncbi:MAG: PcfJ domain-containing protein [Fibrobacter sp.]|nr:PcfJ domain-containing protein [Fibrobacter sp.]